MIFIQVFITPTCADNGILNGTFNYYSLYNGVNSFESDILPIDGYPCSEWGDYSGVAVDPNDDNTMWFCGQWANYWNIWGTQIGEFSSQGNVVFANVLNKTGTPNAGGNLLVNSTTTIFSGSSLTIPIGYNNVQTYDERFQESDGYYKHNFWTDVRQNSIPTNYLFSQQFILDNTNFTGNEVDADFTILSPATITNQFEGMTTTGGNIQFLDPWYMSTGTRTNAGAQPNAFMTEQAPFVPSGSYIEQPTGIFLNQGYNPNNNRWTEPYYQVGANIILDGVTLQSKIIL